MSTDESNKWKRELDSWLQKYQKQLLNFPIKISLNITNTQKISHDRKTCLKKKNSVTEYLLGIYSFKKLFLRTILNGCLKYLLYRVAQFYWFAEIREMETYLQRQIDTNDIRKKIRSYLQNFESF